MIDEPSTKTPMSTTRSAPIAPNSFELHDHQHCQTQTVEKVNAICQEQGLRLTPIRAQVLEILLESHKALGAYDILARLSDGATKPQPPVAYRALDFLVNNGFAHRIEKLNAFIACHCPDHTHNSAFLICQKCGLVAELLQARFESQLEEAGQKLGFEINTTVIEALGICQNCRQAEHEGAPASQESNR